MIDGLSRVKRVLRRLFKETFDIEACKIGSKQTRSAAISVFQGETTSNKKGAKC